MKGESKWINEKKTFPPDQYHSTILSSIAINSTSMYDAVQRYEAFNLAFQFYVIYESLFWLLPMCIYFLFFFFSNYIFHETYLYFPFFWRFDVCERVRYVCHWSCCCAVEYFSVHHSREIVCFPFCFHCCNWNDPVNLSNYSYFDPYSMSLFSYHKDHFVYFRSNAENNHNLFECCCCWLCYGLSEQIALKF